MRTQPLTIWLALKGSTMVTKMGSTKSNKKSTQLAWMKTQLKMLRELWLTWLPLIWEMLCMLLDNWWLFSLTSSLVPCKRVSQTFMNSAARPRELALSRSSSRTCLRTCLSSWERLLSCQLWFNHSQVWRLMDFTSRPTAWGATWGLWLGWLLDLKRMVNIDISLNHFNLILVWMFNRSAINSNKLSPFIINFNILIGDNS